jgi:hypothetical protein
MPKNAIRFRTIHPRNRKDVYIHVAVVPKTGIRGGRTVAEKIHYVGSKRIKKIMHPKYKHQRKYII